MIHVLPYVMIFFKAHFTHHALLDYALLKSALVVVYHHHNTMHLLQPIINDHPTTNVPLH